jgi:hypothetical protein
MKLHTVRPYIHHTGLRVYPEFIEGTNGAAVEILRDFSVHAEPVEGFFGLVKN